MGTTGFVSAFHHPHSHMSGACNHLRIRSQFDRRNPCTAPGAGSGGILLCHGKRFANELGRLGSRAKQRFCGEEDR